MYPTCALASSTNTSVVAEGGGVQGILIVMYRYDNEQTIRTREKPIKGGAHVCVVGDRADALGCIWLKNYRVIAFKTFMVAERIV